MSLAQSKRRGRFDDVAQELAEESFVFFPRDAETRLRDEIAERQRSGQAARIAEHVRMGFAQHDLESRMVADQVVHRQPHQPAAVVLARTMHAQQRGLPNVEPFVAHVDAFFYE